MDSARGASPVAAFQLRGPSWAKEAASEGVGPRERRRPAGNDEVAVNWVFVQAHTSCRVDWRSAGWMTRSVEASCAEIAASAFVDPFRPSTRDEGLAVSAVDSSCSSLWREHLKVMEDDVLTRTGRQQSGASS